MHKIDYLILGAGPTGLGAAWHLNAVGAHDWLLLERSAAPGGLAASFVDEHGFTWDIGGHIQFSHYEYFDQAMDHFLGKDGWFHHQRESWVWMRDRFIPYPFQNNIYRLPPDDLERCLAGLLNVFKNGHHKTGNFREWILAKFGQGIADIFLLPYNYKVWAYPPEMMSSHWVGERVAETDLRRVLHNLVHKKDDVSWGPNNTFRFPKRGGTGAIWRACASLLPQSRLQFNTPVTHIDLDKRVVIAGDEQIGYRNLISTMPLTDLIRLSGQTQFVPLAEQGLLYSSSNIFGIGLKGLPPESLRTKCWMYFPEDNCPFYRVTVFSNYSPFNVPEPGPYWSLMCEVSESPFKPVSQKHLLSDVIDGALATNLIQSSEDILSTWSYRAKYGYPVPGQRREAALSQVIPFFEERNVYSRGRFGLWKYEVSNQDHAFMQGVEIVERLHNGSPELTALDANHVNSSYNPWPLARCQPVSVPS